VGFPPWKTRAQERDEQMEAAAQPLASKVVGKTIAIDVPFCN